MQFEENFKKSTFASIFIDFHNGLKKCQKKWEIKYKNTEKESKKQKRLKKNAIKKIMKAKRTNDIQKHREKRQLRSENEEKNIKKTASFKCFPKMKSAIFSRNIDIGCHPPQDDHESGK